MSLVGQQLGEFEILEHLGQGGMGAVYKARQTSLGRLVALKTLQGNLADDAEYIARFQQEARAAAGLNHPNLVQVYSAGENEGLRWFAMEYVEGESAKGRLKRKGRIAPLEALAIAIHVATALEYGWRKARLIHRDIKPDNIFLSSDGEVKLGDLGLAKSIDQNKGLTTTGHSMGSPYYISPEQVQDMKMVDLRADIYSLGCTLFHMLSGQPVFDGSSAVAVMIKHVNSTAPELTNVWPECPPVLNEVVGGMMQKEPEKRPQNYPELITKLRHVYDFLSGHRGPQVVAVTHAEVGAPRRGAPPLPAPARSKALLYAGIGVAVVALATAAFFLVSPKDDIHARDHAGGGTRSVVSPTSEGEGGEKVGAEKAVPSSVALPAGATKDAQFVNSLGMKFVPVPGTKVLFSIWDTRVQDYDVFAKETSWKVTKARHEQGPLNPVVNVRWEDAKAFCAWLTARERKAGLIGLLQEYRLPTDEEWSVAVGLPKEEGSTPSAKSGKIYGVYPWGTGWPPPKGAGNYLGEGETPLSQKAPGMFQGQEIIGYRDGFEKTSPVGSFAANRFGLYDMGGNVDQFVEDWYDASMDYHTLRGDSWWSADDPRAQMHSSFRRRQKKDYAVNDAWGFRCVLEF